MSSPVNFNQCPLRQKGTADSPMYNVELTEMLTLLPVGCWQRPRCLVKKGGWPLLQSGASPPRGGWGPPPAKPEWGSSSKISSNLSTLPTLLIPVFGCHLVAIYKRKTKKKPINESTRCSHVITIKRPSTHPKKNL